MVVWRPVQGMPRSNDRWDKPAAKLENGWMILVGTSDQLIDDGAVLFGSRWSQMFNLQLLVLFFFLIISSQTPGSTLVHVCARVCDQSETCKLV